MKFSDRLTAEISGSRYATPSLSKSVRKTLFFAAITVFFVSLMPYVDFWQQIILGVLVGIRLLTLLLAGIGFGAAEESAYRVALLPAESRAILTNKTRLYKPRS